MSDDQRVIKSYVWHKGRCFFVSTIERDSSAMLDPGRYNETLVWDYDWDGRTSKSLMYQRDCVRGSIRRHLAVCQELFDKGELTPEDP
jgi:hypothetical protein